VPTVTQDTPEPQAKFQLVIKTSWHDTPQNLPAPPGPNPQIAEYVRAISARWKPKRTRGPKLKPLLEHARKVGATSVTYRGAVIHLTGDGQPQAANGDAAATPEPNEWDKKYGPH
jgi:hypothetical protein